MTTNEKYLIEMIRNSNNPTLALVTAIKIITDFLEQPQSFQEQATVCPQVHV